MDTIPTPPVGAPRPRAPQKPTRQSNLFMAWFVRATLLGITAFILLVFLGILYVAARQLQYDGLIYPGVSAYGINLSGMTKQQAVTTLASRYTYGKSAVFTFRDGSKIWQRTADDLGVQFDPQKTVDEAYNVGRNGSLLSNLMDQASALVNGYAIQPQVVFDESKASGFLQSVATDVDRPMKDASIVLTGTTVTTSPSQVGRTLDVNATLGLLRPVILNLNTGSEIPLVINETKPTIADSEAVATKVRAALSSPIQLYINQPIGAPTPTPVPTADASTTDSGQSDQPAPETGPWLVSPEFITGLISIVRVDDGNGTAHYEVNANTDPLRNYFTALAPHLEIDPVNARFLFDEQSGQLNLIKDSTDGRSLDVDATLSAVENIFFQKDNRRVALIFHPEPAQVTSKSTAAQLGIKEEVVESTTFFYGSTEERRTNIQVAASQFQGLVIAPGEEFSFDKYLGDVSPESGYQSGLIIVGNQTITGVGGGVCQVSSTVFQAAFFGGFPIKERYPHGYRVGYYESGAAIANGTFYNSSVGLDATVYAPIVDLKFDNDTPYYLLMESIFRPSEQSLTFKFFSTSMNRTVIKDGPVLSNQVPHGPTKYEEAADLAPGQQRQVDYAVDGVDVHVYRTVKQDGKITIDHEDFFSHYLPWSAVFQVAPGYVPRGQ